MAPNRKKQEQTADLTGPANPAPDIIVKIWFNHSNRKLEKKTGRPSSNAAPQGSWDEQYAKIEAWYRDRVKNWSGKPPTRDQDLESARAVFGKDVRSKVIREDLRPRLAPQWTEPGRPRRSNKSGNN
jgi:hypothetical protein